MTDDIVARAQGVLDDWASTYQVDRGVLLEHEVATVAELAAEVERLRSDPTLALMGSELEKLAAERDQLKAALERVRAWAIEQGRPFPDGVRDREGEAVQAGCVAALDGDDGKGEAP